MKIYENLNLNDRLNFQIAQNEIYCPEIPTHDKLSQYICPVCLLSQIDYSNFCKDFGDNNFFVSKGVYQKIKNFSQKIQYQTKFVWPSSQSENLDYQGSLASLIEHISENHLNYETRHIFEVMFRTFTLNIKNLILLKK